MPLRWNESPALPRGDYQEHSTLLCWFSPGPGTCAAQGFSGLDFAGCRCIGVCICHDRHVAIAKGGCAGVAFEEVSCDASRIACSGATFYSTRTLGGAVSR